MGGATACRPSHTAGTAARLIPSGDPRPSFWPRRSMLHEQVNVLCCPLHLGVVYPVMDEFSLALGDDQSCRSQNLQVLGGDGLLQIQRAVDFVDIDALVLVNKFQNLKPQRVRQCAQ